MQLTLDPDELRIVKIEGDSGLYRWLRERVSSAGAVSVYLMDASTGQYRFVGPSQLRMASGVPVHIRRGDPILGRHHSRPVGTP